MQAYQNFNSRRWLVLFIAVHLLMWSVVPALIRYNLPLDSIEGTIWGQQLQWGYDKNPFLNGWLTAVATYLDGNSGWMIYFFSQLSVAICFWAVWQLTKKMLSPVYALIAVMSLELIQYYNFHAIDFNDNTLELGLWALIIYFFYQACRHATYRAWILTGVFAALGMLAKYYTAALLASMLIFFFTQADLRKQLKSLPVYACLATFIALMTPHIIWLFLHDFITVTYVFERAKNIPHWSNHIVFPLRFAWQQLQTFIPALFVCLLLALPKSPENEQGSISKFDKDYLLFLGAGPFLLTLILSLGIGITLRAGWGMPLLSLWPVIVLVYLRPTITTTKYYVFVTSIFITMTAFLSIYSLSLILSKDPTSANYPGQAIASSIAKEWHATYHTKLAYVAGSRWVGGNIEFYSQDHPAVFVEWDKRHAPWINLTDLHKKGAVFVWEITGNEYLPNEIKQKYPQLKNSKVLEFSYYRNRNHLEPVKIGMAMLPPMEAAVG